MKAVEALKSAAAQHEAGQVVIAALDGAPPRRVRIRRERGRRGLLDGSD